MLFAAIFRRRSRPSQSSPQKGGRRARPRFVPRLEALEARTLLSAGYAFQSVNAPGASTAAGQGTQPETINDQGQIVGYYQDTGSVYHGFLLSQGQYTTLNDPNAGTAAGQGTTALGINKSGVIVGGYYDASGVEHGFTLSGDHDADNYKTLDDPNAGTAAGQGTSLMSVNDKGQIVGDYTDSSGVEHGFLYSNGKFTTLDDPNAGTGAGQGTVAACINNSGQVVGGYFDASGVEHGFLYSNGKFTTIDAPNSSATEADGINNNGQIVGNYVDSKGVEHGFLLGGDHDADNYTTLDDPKAGTATGQGTLAFDINDCGQIIGSYLDASGSLHGFLATPYDFHSLNAPGASTAAGQGTQPETINDQGQIVGYYQDTGSVYHGFLLGSDHDADNYTILDDPNAGTAAGQGTTALGINKSGVIVGGYYDASGVEHGFILSGDHDADNYKTLDDPNAGTAAGQGTSLMSINDKGQIVGDYTDSSGVEHSFLYSNGKFTTLDDPNAGTGAGQGTVAACINNSGQVVGGYFDASGVEHGFLYSNGKFTTIDAPNSGATEADGINNNGQIVGNYVDANGVEHGFILSGGQYSIFNDPKAGTATGQGTLAFDINDCGQIIGSYLDASGALHGFLATPAQSGHSDHGGHNEDGTSWSGTDSGGGTGSGDPTETPADQFFAIVGNESGFGGHSTH